MGSKDALSAWIEQERFLDGANRPLRLRIGSLSKELDGVLLPQRVSGGDAICGAIDYEHIVTGFIVSVGGRCLGW